MVNSTADDIGPAYFQNPGGTDLLYFTSNRPGRGGFDIYTSQVAADGSFGTPLLEQALSSTSNEARTAIRADGLEVVFQTNRPPNRLADLWASTRATVLDPWGAPTSLGPPVNSTGNDRQPALSDDAEVLMYASGRHGLFDDIWISERDCTEGPNAPVTDADGDGTGDACDLAFSTPVPSAAASGPRCRCRLGSVGVVRPVHPGRREGLSRHGGGDRDLHRRRRRIERHRPELRPRPGASSTAAFSLPQALQARRRGSFATIGSAPARRHCDLRRPPPTMRSRSSSSR